MYAVTEDEKLESLRAMETHVSLARREREFYMDFVRRSQQTRESEEKFVHVTFDFSQNVNIPHYARQPGPLYFLTLRKVQIFGVRIDGLPRQLNFLIDEDQTLGKEGGSTHGPDAVISMLDWAVQIYGRESATCSIHADNCPGQNKNRYVLGYFMWRVMTGQHSRIKYHMQIPGHARCLVDSSFAHIKIKYRGHNCETLDHLADIVERSSTTNTAIRHPQWAWREWKPFLDEHFRSLPGIRQYQHFSFDTEKPGVVSVKANPEAEEQDFSILKDPDFRFLSSARPPVVPAAGMFNQRKLYLQREVIRQPCFTTILPFSVIVSAPWKKDT